jgi:hypothetical protein
MNTLRLNGKIALIPCLLLFAAFCTAQTITGTVHNQTTEKPSVGDDVILLRLDNGMLEETHARTDGQGAFALNVQFTDLPHIVRVMHQGVNYDRTITGKAPLEINVFDSSAKLENVGVKISILKVESDGKNFNITELHEVDNESAPQRTQASPSNFGVALPDGAQMDSVMVSGPGGVQVKADAAPVAGKAGRYVIGYPLRPGPTRYWIKYHLPYGNRVVFHPILPYAAKLFSVQYPKSMTFVASEKSGFHPIVDQDGMRVEGIAHAKAGSIPQFELSGVGTLPPDSQVTRAQPRTVPAQPPTSAANKPDRSQPPAGESGASTSQRSNTTVFAIIAAVVGALGILVFLAWRARAATRRATLEALKEKLFELENARLRGSISAEQYTATKQTLNRSLEQVVGKGAPNE